MSRKIIYNKEMLTALWNEFQASGSKNLKSFCRDKTLNYISIYTAFRNNDFMTFLKKKNTEPKDLENKELTKV